MSDENRFGAPVRLPDLLQGPALASSAKLSSLFGGMASSGPVRTIPDVLKGLAAAPENFTRWQQQLEEQSRLVLRFADKIGEAATTFANRYASVCDAIARSLVDLPDRTRAAVKTLATNGWYVDPHSGFSESAHAKRLFDIGQPNEAHEYLCDYFADRVDDIETDLCTRFPHRARILKQAFGAHRREEYALSIPVFLAQADGICPELMGGVQLYSRRRKDGQPHLAVALAPLTVDSLESAFEAGLVEPFPINARPDERVGLVDFLNRHMVLHGEDCAYDTAVNSYRSVSLLGYAAWILDKTPLTTP